MKKRLIGILCAVMLLFSVMPQSVSAASGNLEGVDYTRIMDVTDGHQVTLSLGELEFTGYLTNGSELSVEERDRIIKQAMNDMKITSGMLLNAESLIKAAQNVKGFGMDDVIRATMKLSGASDLLAIYSFFMGTTKDPAVVAKDIATAQLNDTVMNGLEDVFKDSVTNGGTIALKGLGKFSAKLLFMLPDLAEVGLDALAKYENNKYIVAMGTERLVLLEAFYRECNDRIKEAAGESGEWRILFDKTQNYRTYNATFWGVSGVMMSAELSGVLEKVGNNDDVTGEYKGTLWLDVEMADATSFDDQFSKSGTFKVMLDSLKAKQISGQAQDVYTKTVLELQTQTDVSVTIKAASGTQTADVSGKFTANSDDIVFEFDHNFLLDVTAPLPQYGGITIHEYGSYHFTSSDITKLTQVTTIYTEESGANGYSIVGSKTPSAPDVAPAPSAGTIWKPLENAPIITIYLGK